MKISDQRKLFGLIDAFLAVPVINTVRHLDGAADGIACEIEALLDNAGIPEPDDDTTQAAAALGRKGGAATSDAKRRAVAENGKRGGYWAQKRNQGKQPAE
jgi:hypothetical protein